MPGLLDGIMAQLGPSGITQISRALGVEESAVGSAISTALPAILAGMAGNAKDSSGATKLADALNDHDISIFGQLGELLGGQSDGAAILGHVLGGKQPKIEHNVAEQSGIDLGAIMKLLPILAPLVMGYLSQEKSSRGLDAGGLSDVLARERDEAEERRPGLGGLASILDADGDGSVIDDVLDKLTGND